jgi:hypothetical protein
MNLHGVTFPIIRHKTMKREEKGEAYNTARLSRKAR